MSQHVSQNVSQNPGHPKAPGMYVSNRSQKAEVSQRRPKLCPIKIPKSYGFPRRPKGHSQPPPKINGITNMSQSDFSNNDVQSDTVSPCGPRGSNSNVVQRSSNNDGNACKNHAFNSIASAKCYCGKLYGTYVENSGVGGSVPVWGHWKARACLCIAQGLRV
jgi:hypothetical protein